MDPKEMEKLMADDAAAENPPPPDGGEISVPMTALTAAGENPGDEAQPEEGDAVAVQLEGKFVRAEGGNGIIRVSTANGEPMTPPTPEPLADEGEALRAAAEEGGY